VAYRNASDNSWARSHGNNRRGRNRGTALSAKFEARLASSAKSRAKANLALQNLAHPKTQVREESPPGATHGTILASLPFPRRLSQFECSVKQSIDVNSR
jgi:hypothetical protein